MVKSKDRVGFNPAYSLWGKNVDMFIDWKKIETDKLPINYFGITLADNEIIKNCIYYHYTQYRAFQENHAIEYLKNRGYIKLFEIGYDNKQKTIKSNYHVHSDFCDVVLQVFSDEFYFFDEIPLREFFSWQIENKLKFFNASMSVEQLEDDMSKIKRVCLYFSTTDGAYFPVELLNKLVYRIFGQQKTFIFPEGACSWLHLISFEFRDDKIKLKFYYGMKEGFNFSRFEKLFGNTSIIKDIFHTNGFLEGFQIALSKNERNTYNFYFKKSV